VVIEVVLNPWEMFLELTDVRNQTLCQVGTMAILKRKPARTLPALRPRSEAPGGSAEIR